MYFPQALKWFGEITSEIAGDFLEKWPTLQKAQKARPETIRQFLVQRHGGVKGMNAPRDHAYNRRGENVGVSQILPLMKISNPRRISLRDRPDFRRK